MHPQTSLGQPYNSGYESPIADKKVEELRLREGEVVLKTM
jgi:hypothetical protein